MKIPPPKLPTPKLVVKAKGPSSRQLDSFDKFATIFKRTARAEASNLLRSLAAKVVKEVKTALLEQRYAWVPLTEDYLKAKIKAGLDTRTLLATLFYFHHISWWRDSNGVHMGVPNVQHPTAKIPLGMLARVHEYGTARIPARPLWRPALSKILREFPKLREEYYRKVKSQLPR